MLTTAAERRYTWQEAGRLDLLVSPHGEVVATVTAGQGELAAQLANLVRSSQGKNKWTAAARANIALGQVDGYNDDVLWDDDTGSGYTAADYRKLLGV
jgi:hypothetical protein